MVFCQSRYQPIVEYSLRPFFFTLISPKIFMTLSVDGGLSDMPCEWDLVMCEVHQWSVVEAVLDQQLLSFLDVTTQQLSLHVVELFTQTCVLLTHTSRLWSSSRLVCAKLHSAHPECLQIWQNEIPWDFQVFPEPPNSLFQTIIKWKPDVTNHLSSQFGSFLAELQNILLQ